MLQQEKKNYEEEIRREKEIKEEAELDRDLTKKKLNRMIQENRELEKEMICMDLNKGRSQSDVQIVKGNYYDYLTPSDNLFGNIF